MKSRGYVKLKCGARLHLQLIDPVGISGYRRGGIGIALKQPSIEVIATTTTTVLEKKSLKGFEENIKYLRELIHEKKLMRDLDGIKIFIKTNMRNHIGLGAGTICRTLIRKAIAELLDLDNDIYGLTSLTGVGQYAVLKGGFVIVGPIPNEALIPSQVFRGDKGVRTTPSLIGSFHLPTAWKVVLCIPKSPEVHGLSGIKESKYYSNLKPPKISDVHKVSFEILAKLIPAIQFQDFSKFEEALGTITELCWKRTEKNLQKKYWNLTSKALFEIGAKFVGVTSGGPTTFSILDSNVKDMKRIKLQLEKTLFNVSNIVISDINNDGLHIYNSSERAQNNED